MSAAPAIGAPARPADRLGRITWHLRHDPKVELWVSWYAMVFFYNLFGVVFCMMTRVIPPPKPWWDTPRVLQWFNDNHTGLLVGFGIIFMIAGLVAACNALIGYSMRRMSVSKVFSYSYIAIYSLAATPGMLLTAVTLTVGAMRPERDPELTHLIYDMGILCFNGTMGVFLIGTLVWMTAVLLDKNRVFPRWFGYLNICNALTEVVVSPCWIFSSGVFAWNGIIAFWIDTLVFAVYTVIFITLLRKMILRDDLGDGPLPPLKSVASGASA